MKNIKIKQSFTGICYKNTEAPFFLKSGTYSNYNIIEIINVPDEISTEEVISIYNKTAIASRIYCIDFKLLGHNNNIITH